MVLDEIGSPGQRREHVRKLFLQPGYIGELGGREVIYIYVIYTNIYMCVCVCVCVYTGASQ